MLTVKNFIIIQGFYQPSEIKKNLRQPFCRERHQTYYAEEGLEKLGGSLISFVSSMFILRPFQLTIRFLVGIDVQFRQIWLSNYYALHLQERIFRCRSCWSIVQDFNGTHCTGSLIILHSWIWSISERNLSKKLTAKAII